MYTLLYYLPGIFVWAIGAAIFLSFFLQYFGTGWGPPFWAAYLVFLALFVLTLWVKPPLFFRSSGGGGGDPPDEEDYSSY